MKSRIFSVRINLDEMNASLLRWRSSESRADWLDGFMLGCSGVAMDGTEPYSQANKIGLAYHASAVAFQVDQSAKANRRWNAAALPRHKLGNAPAMPRHESGIAAEMPGQCQSNNRIIEQSNDQVTVNQGADAAASIDDVMTSMQPEEPAHVAQALDRRTFADWRIIIGRRIFWTREEDSAWKAMYQAEGWDEMTRGYEYLAKKHPEPAKLFLSYFQEIR